MTEKVMRMMIVLGLGLSLVLGGCGTDSDDDENEPEDTELKDGGDGNDTDGDAGDSDNTDETLADGVPSMDDLEGTWVLAEGTMNEEESGELDVTELTEGSMILSISGETLLLYSVDDECYEVTESKITDIDEDGNLTDENEQLSGSEDGEDGLLEWGSMFEGVDGQLFVEYWETEDGSETEIEMYFDREDIELPPTDVDECEE